MQRKHTEIAEEKHPKSRGSHKRAKLSREKIVLAAIQIADAEGEQELSMPKLARHLGAGTMSLYRHVENRADLLQGMLDHVALGIPHPPSSDDPIDEVVAVFGALQSTMVDKPWIVPILSGCEGYSRHIFPLLDRILDGLQAIGLSEHDTKMHYDMFLEFAYGSALSAHGKSRFAAKQDAEKDHHLLLEKHDRAPTDAERDILASSVSEYRQMVRLTLVARAFQAQRSFHDKAK